MARPLRFLTSTVYLSAAEGKLYDVALESASQIPKCLQGVQHVAHFADKAYARSSFVFLGESESICRATINFAKTIFDNATLRKPQVCIANHPHLGLLDHICVQPIETEDMGTAAAVAERTATQVATACNVPCFLYGVPGRPSLAEIRRASGRYFRARTPPVAEGSRLAEQGKPQQSSAGNGLFTPSYGPHGVQWPEDGGLGICCIGAASYVLNYNIPIHASISGTADATAAAQVQADVGMLVKQWARQVSTRGGGLPSVEAMGLLNDSGTHALPGAQPGPGAVSCHPAPSAASHENGERTVTWEIACNLLDPDVTTPTHVFQHVSNLVAEAPSLHSVGAAANLRLGADYIIGLTRQQLKDKAEAIRGHLDGSRGGGML